MMEQKFSFSKLNNDNYFNWKFSIELLLIKRECWNVISTDKPTDVKDDWYKRDSKARAIIGLAVEENHLRHIRNTKSAKEAWDALKNHHEKSTLCNKVSIMRQICNLKLQEHGDMEDHLNKMSDLFGMLSNLGEDELSDASIVAMLLSSLPRSYDTLKTALESRPEGDLTLSLVQTKLFDESKRRNGADIIVKKEIAMKVNQECSKEGTKKGVTCYFCHKKNHMKKDCRRKKLWLQKKSSTKANQVTKANVSNNKSDDMYCFTVRENHVNTCGRWIIDSGASCHIANKLNLFSDYEMSEKQSVEVANGQQVQGSGKGSVTITFQDGTMDFRYEID